MFTLILKTLWTRRRRNGWLLAELILVAVLSWIIFDPVIVRCRPPLHGVCGRTPAAGVRL